MTVEVATTIATLDSALPAATDPKSEGDDHIRLIKSVLKANLSNVNNTSDANKPVSTATQAALDLKLNAANPSYTGTLTGTSGGAVIPNAHYYSGRNAANTISIPLIGRGTDNRVKLDLDGYGLDIGGGTVNIGSGQFVKDASGNVGLGVTPSAWGGYGRTMEILGAGSFVGSAGGAGLESGTSCYYASGAWRYALTGVQATRYRQLLGAHEWYTAPSGTAGNPISFTQAMTLDASGNLTVNGTAGFGVVPGAGMTIRTAAPSGTDLGKYAFAFDGTFNSSTTSFAVSCLSQPSTAAASFTLANLTHFRAAQGTVGAGSVVTGQYGFLAASSLTGATNNYGFYSDIPAGPNRWNFYANGSADNYFGGNVTVGGGGTLGYGAGSGGTVTQVTSKATTVTLNKPCGQITMHNAALADATTVIMPFLNSTIGDTDTVVFTCDGGFGANYLVWGVNPLAGSISVAVRNVSGVSQSQALVINYAVIKGSST